MDCMKKTCLQYTTFLYEKLNNWLLTIQGKDKIKHTNYNICWMFISKYYSHFGHFNFLCFLSLKMVMDFVTQAIQLTKRLRACQRNGRAHIVVIGRYSAHYSITQIRRPILQCFCLWWWCSGCFLLQLFLLFLLLTMLLLFPSSIWVVVCSFSLIDSITVFLY